MNCGCRSLCAQAPNDANTVQRAYLNFPYYIYLGCYGQGILCNDLQEERHTRGSASCGLHHKTTGDRQTSVRLRHAE